jgi:hypothetical protein
MPGLFLGTAAIPRGETGVKFHPDTPQAWMDL